MRVTSVFSIQSSRGSGSAIQPSCLPGGDVRGFINLGGWGAQARDKKNIDRPPERKETKSRKKKKKKKREKRARIQSSCDELIHFCEKEVGDL